MRVATDPKPPDTFERVAARMHFRQEPPNEEHVANGDTIKAATDISLSTVGAAEAKVVEDR